MRSIPRVEPKVCAACYDCPAKKVCRIKALVQLDAGEPPFIDVDLCHGCGLCIAECVYQAIAFPKA